MNVNASFHDLTPPEIFAVWQQLERSLHPSSSSDALRLSGDEERELRRLYYEISDENFNHLTESEFKNLTPLIIGHLKKIQHLQFEHEPLRLFDHLMANIFGILKPASKIEKEVAQTDAFDRKTRRFSAPREIMSTPYAFLYRMLEAAGLKMGDHVVDLGSGYGNLGHLIGMNRPDLNFTGLELVGPRAALAQSIADRFRLTNARHRQFDLAQDLSKLPAADLYYLFDPIERDTRIKLIKTLDVIACRKERPLQLVAVSGWSDEILEDLNFSGCFTKTKEISTWDSSYRCQIYSS